MDFGKYLKRIVREETAECWFCGAEMDDNFHTLIECPQWREKRVFRGWDDPREGPV